jgi:signal transduction histidine kinase
MNVRKLKMPPLVKSLSARLLVLTVAFVMLAEVLIFAPSIGRFRLVWFQEHISAAHLATLALEATPTRMISKELERELLRHVGGHGVFLQRPDTKVLMLNVNMPPHVDSTVDLRQGSFFGLIGDAFSALVRTQNRVLRVMGPSPQDPDVMVSVVLDEAPLRQAMLGYGRRILVLSIIISLFTAALVYLSLQWLLVAPMRRITSSMVAFRERPQSPEAAISDSGRSDEIGIAERELAAMQTGLHAALKQREHLAALGEAVAKINHDLRNILATARLVSDRLAQSDDPEAKRASPTLIRVIDRAVNMCTQTLNFAEVRTELNRERFNLGEMLAEAQGTIAAFGVGAGTRLRVDIPEGATLWADRDQMFRVFANLLKNAADAGAPTVTVRSGPRQSNGATVIDIADDGPGIPEKVSKSLFKPFGASGRSGGTGLGLAIVSEIMAAHGGTVALERSGEDGTVFRLTLPAEPA